MSFPVLRSAHVYPVKSLAARACDLVAVEPWGLDGDRRWMLVDKAARAVTQRQQPSMARISAAPLPGGGVLLSAPGFPPQRVEGPDPGRMITVELHRDTVVVEEAPGDAHDWLSAVLGTEVRRIAIGEVAFTVAKPCGRCVTTTTDQRTAERGREPLLTLARHRRFGRQLVFGQNLVPEGTGVIRVGDPVRILDLHDG
ncbi:MOSC domain-containing protein [Streptomyces sp. NPDC091287]|uniref:MOSC domain-containing protein n=1 Tax=Streptomyces sp. NPDC091287 TaxID=3365988 RepID=UPI0038201E4A